MFYTKPDPVVDYSRLKDMDMYPDYDANNVVPNINFSTINMGMNDLYDVNSMGHQNMGNNMQTHNMAMPMMQPQQQQHMVPQMNHHMTHAHAPHNNVMASPPNTTSPPHSNNTNTNTTTTTTSPAHTPATPASSVPATSPQIPFTVAPPAPSGKYVSDDERWQALVDRDPEADGAFIYCVTSTKVYCRPTCSARLALRSNIVYFDTMKEAVSAGYRPCRRCNPDVSEMNSQRRAVGSVCNLIHSLEPDKVPRVKKLAESVGLTLWHFHRLFKRYTGLTPRQYITEFHKRKRLGLPQLQVSKVVTKKSYERQQRRQGGSNGSTPQQSPSVAATSPETAEIETIKLEQTVPHIQQPVPQSVQPVQPVSHMYYVENNGQTAPTASVATPHSNTTSPENTTPAQDSAYIIGHGNAGPSNAPVAPATNPEGWVKTEPTLDFMPRYEPRYDQSISIDAPIFIPDATEYHHGGEMLGDMWGTL